MAKLEFIQTLNNFDYYSNRQSRTVKDEKLTNWIEWYWRYALGEKDHVLGEIWDLGKQNNEDDRNKFLYWE